MGVDRRAKLRSAIEALQPPEALPERVPGTSETTKAAWCPLIDRLCGMVNCADCTALERYYINCTQSWFCSVCARLVDGERQPYWTDGHCEECGDYSIVLSLVVR